MTSAYTHRDHQTRVANAGVTATAASRSSGASMVPSAHRPTVTSRASPITSNSSSSDVEAQNREETKEEEQATDPYLEDFSGSPGATSPSPRRHPVTRRSVGPTSDAKDLDDTGKWGSITKKEKIIVASCGGLILVAIAVVVGVMVAGTSNKGGGGGASPSTGDNTNSTTSLPPSAAPEAFETADDKYASLLNLLNGNPLTRNSTLRLPGFLRELDSVNDAAEHDPTVKAAKWVMLVDTANMFVDQLRDRFALASIYYGNNGENWLENDGWLSNDHVCKWGGEANEQVKCSINAESGHEVVNELDLSNNNLTGTVPSTMALLTTLKGIWLRENGLSGNIPGEVFGSLPKLIILYLQDNNFEGEIPISLLDSGSLGTLYLNGNNLTGTWPDEFCPGDEYPDGPFTEFGLNCEQTPCPEECCLPENNCFA